LEIPPWSSSAASDRSSPGARPGGEQIPPLPSLAGLASPLAEYMPTRVVVKGIGHIGAPLPTYLRWDLPPTLSPPSPSLEEIRKAKLPSLLSWLDFKDSTVQGGSSESSSFYSPYQGSGSDSQSRMSSYYHSSYPDPSPNFNSCSYSSWARISKTYSRRQKMAIGGIVSLYGMPAVAATFNQWDTLRVASGVASMGTGTAVIPLQQVEGVPERAWIW
jgi:hypothetical protein